MAISQEQLQRIKNIQTTLDRIMPLASKFGAMQRKFVEGQRQQGLDLSSGIREKIRAYKENRPAQLSQGQKSAQENLLRGVAGFTSPLAGAKGSFPTQASSIGKTSIPDKVPFFKEGINLGEKVGAIKTLFGKAGIPAKEGLELLKDIINPDVINFLK